MHATDGGTTTWKTRAFAFYEKHEAKASILFFIGGFVFDAVMLPGIDDPLAYVQQAAYLLFVSLILLYDFQWGQDATVSFGPAWVKRAWPTAGY